MDILSSGNTRCVPEREGLEASFPTSGAARRGGQTSRSRRLTSHVVSECGRDKGPEGGCSCCRGPGPRQLLPEGALAELAYGMPLMMHSVTVRVSLARLLVQVKTTRLFDITAARCDAEYNSQHCLESLRKSSRCHVACPTRTLEATLSPCFVPGTSGKIGISADDAICEIRGVRAFEIDVRRGAARQRELPCAGMSCQLSNARQLPFSSRSRLQNDAVRWKQSTHAIAKQEFRVKPSQLGGIFFSKYFRTKLPWYFVCGQV